MNSVHDMGGMHNFGPISPAPDEPIFHSDWERRVLAMNVAAGMLGAWNIDVGRHTRERMPAADYLASSYYEKWLYGLERLLIESGLVSQDELDARRADLKSPVTPTPHPRRLDADRIEAAIARGSPARVDARIQARFKSGDPVRTKRINPVGHTRLPRYARGCHGVIARDHGVQIFADGNGMREGQQPQHLYCVRFMASELWGLEANPVDAVHIDLWETHLEAA